MKTVIYDIEIEKAILGKDETRIKGIEYCDGFRDFENMGVSVIGACEYETGRYRVFCKDNFDEFQKLVNDADFVVDFNGVQFDAPALAAVGITIPAEKQYDILREIWEAEGHDPDVFTKETHLGYGLDACCVANFGAKKTGNGAMAPVFWQNGEIGTVIDYCLNDVKLTERLFGLIDGEGCIVSPKDPDKTIQLLSPRSPF